LIVIFSGAECLWIVFTYLDVFQFFSKSVDVTERVCDFEIAFMLAVMDMHSRGAVVEHRFVFA
jgi:hypothetical protein